MPKILWITTFSKDLWGSAELLFDSYVACGVQDRLVAYTEGGDPPAPASVWFRPLDGHPILKNFLKAHRGLIPQNLGGSAPIPECRCKKGPLDVHAKSHSLPCVGYWFCKNAFRWLRKPLAASLACQEFAESYDILMWLDSDTSFIEAPTPETVESWFKTPKGMAGCIYAKSKRPAIETGVFGYHLKHGGPRIAAAVLDRYCSGVFRHDHRWDDCVQMEKGIAKAKIRAVDLATNVGPNATVIQFTPMGAYVTHDKGRHRRQGVLR